MRSLNKKSFLSLSMLMVGWYTSQSIAEVSNPPDGATIFVTSERFNGNLGGIEGANLKCSEAATKAGLAGNWKALLSDGEQSARSRFTLNRAVYNTQGERIAQSFTDLFDGQIDNSIKYDEFGNRPRRRRGVWTGSAFDGSSAEKSCGYWTSASVHDRGRVGKSTRSKSGWLSLRSRRCNRQYRIYCLDTRETIHTQTIWALVSGTLSISTDGGNTFSAKTWPDGISHVTRIFVNGSKVYAIKFIQTYSLNVSTDGGVTFKKTFSSFPTPQWGLHIQDMIEQDGVVYIATSEGLLISHDGGNTFALKTTADGLGSNVVMNVRAHGSNVYAGTLVDDSGPGGLSVSHDGGNTFLNMTMINEFPTTAILELVLHGPNILAAPAFVELPPGATLLDINLAIYASKRSGIAISTDGAQTFSTKTTANGLPTNSVRSLFADGSTIYAGGREFNFIEGFPLPVGSTDTGLAISTDGGNTFATRTIADGLGSNSVNKVYAAGSSVYAATSGGLSISHDGGQSFTNRTTADGLGSNVISDVQVVADTVYAVTTTEDGWNGLSISVNGGELFSNKITKTTGTILGVRQLFIVP